MSPDQDFMISKAKLLINQAADHEIWYIQSMCTNNTQPVAVKTALPVSLFVGARLKCVKAMPH